MEIQGLLNHLNYKQKEAVLASDQNIIVLAGAGSGKTRVLVQRIAWLLSVKKCPSESIMALTFTNKSAIEIRQRIEKLLNTKWNNMWIGTFHGLSYRLLRLHYMEANLTSQFQVIDTDDQIHIIKRLIRTMNLNETQWLPQYILCYINKQKEEGLRPLSVNNIMSLNNPKEIILHRIYMNYQETCDRSGLVDFSELLLRSYEMLIKNPKILHYYHERFSNILVDEFQDTNHIQYIWMRTLTGKKCNTMIVGDDDQSIYGWRGAKIKNINNFINDFTNTKKIFLEQNYRSTANILLAANAIIQNNYNRFEKKLWTNNLQGKPITIYCALNELDEANFIINCINDNYKSNKCFREHAILYRSNVQSRLLEEKLQYMKIPYHIYGGMRFFERKEIKDALAYLKLMVNCNDDIAFERIINYPTRGIGIKTFNLIRQTSRDKQLSLWQSSHYLINNQKLSTRIAVNLCGFLELISKLVQEISSLPLYLQVDKVIKRSGLWTKFAEEVETKEIQLENLKELVNAAKQFDCLDKNYNLSNLQTFLSHITIEHNENNNDLSQDAVHLMTLHSAKGLEFPQIYIVGMEEGIFPNHMTLNKPDLIEEERRLAYVGITRAMYELTISYAQKRHIYGKDIYHQPSRFINELPQSCIKKISIFPKENISSTYHILKKYDILSHNGNNIFSLGQKVYHPKFGNGIIVKLENNGDDIKLQIKFHQKEYKWLLASYAQLKIIK